VLAGLLAAANNCEKSGNAEWKAKHTDRLNALVREHMPSGSGFDAGTKLDFSASNPNSLVFTTEFHHMNEHGGYCEWSSHRICVQPSLQFGFVLTVSGRNVRGIKDYIHDAFAIAIEAEVTQ
jgi:hypothetical protein